MARAAKALIWGAVVLAVVVPVAASLTSPLLQYRDAVYIIAGVAGVIALGAVMVQPLLAGRVLPGLLPAQARRAHLGLGFGLVGLVLVHVSGLWITSPPDVVDALLFRSPTPFSAWGVVAMWAVFAAFAVAVFRNRLSWPPRIWRRVHVGLAAVTIAGTVIHALQIEGTMEPVSKAVLCGCVVLAFAYVLITKRRRA